MRVIKFRAWDKEKKEMIYTGLEYAIRILQLDEQIPEISEKENKAETQIHIGFRAREFVRFEIMQFIGIHDRNGKEAYEDDVIKYRKPARHYQTHEGPNIPRPNGKYTEPLEPYIEEKIDQIVFRDSQFTLKKESDNDKKNYSLSLALPFICQDYKKENLMYAFETYEHDVWYDKDEGDLAYLLNEYNLKNENELIAFVSGFEIIGNIHQNPELWSKNES